MGEANAGEPMITNCWTIAEEIRRAIDAYEPVDDRRDKKNILYRMFADRHGWRTTRSAAHLGLIPDRHHLRWINLMQNYGYTRTFDHPYVFKLNRKIIAVAAHLYDFDHDTERECLDLAEKAKDLVTFEHVTDFPSWWYPGRTELVLWRKAV